MINMQSRERERGGEGEREREFMDEELVFVRIFNSHRKWISGIIKKKLGSVSVRVRVSNGQIIRKYVDYVLKRWPAIETGSRGTYTHLVESMGSPSRARYQQMPKEEPNYHNEALVAVPML